MRTDTLRHCEYLGCSEVGDETRTAESRPGKQTIQRPPGRRRSTKAAVVYNDAGKSPIDRSLVPLLATGRARQSHADIYCTISLARQASVRNLLEPGSGARN
ncbi:hypothetical protein J6590_032740 [Homalodisca vitripennis]|nr:hypothetical protein J6590_032740 [Homalodisca vitripennis]